MGGHDVDKWVTIYKRVGIGLLFLTVITVLASYISIGLAAGIALGLFIASIKGSLFEIIATDRSQFAQCD